MQLSDLQPISLFILLAGGAGIVYVVKMFISSQATNNERMWAGLKELTNQWLETVKDSNDTNRQMAREMAAQTVAIHELTAAINRSIEGGYNLNGAAGLMTEALKGVMENEARKR